MVDVMDRGRCRVRETNRWMVFRLACALALLLVLGCGGPGLAVASDASIDDAPDLGEPRGDAEGASIPARLVAFGDVHGDLSALRRVLRLVGAIDGEDRWVGGDLIVVHTGDSIDRGDQDRAVLDLLHRLAGEAAAAGGGCLSLAGNHELMNVAGDTRYASPASKAAFRGMTGLDLDQAPLQALPKKERAHGAAFLPGGPMARILAERQVIAIVGDSIFVHGGVLPANVDYGIDRINGEARAWMLGEETEPPAWIRSDDSPVWSRHYSDDPDAVDCATLAAVLESLGLRRMVVGHTVQKTGISSACDDQVWRIDTGMSAHYGGEVQALEITGETIRILKEPPATPAGPGG